MAQILARLTVPGMAMIVLLLLWLVIRRSGAETTHGTQRRRATRHPLLLPVEVDGKKIVKGLTNDVSLEGCRMNRNLAVRCGQQLALRLHLPWEEPPIAVERAMVRWVGGEDFGLQFVSLHSCERDRLRGLLQRIGGAVTE